MIILYFAMAVIGFHYALGALAIMDESNRHSVCKAKRIRIIAFSCFILLFTLLACGIFKLCEEYWLEDTQIKIKQVEVK